MVFYKVTANEFRARPFSFNKEIQQYWRKILRKSQFLTCNQLRWRIKADSPCCQFLPRYEDKWHPTHRVCARKQKQLMELFSLTHQLLSSPFHMGLTPKVMAICPGLHRQQTVSYDLDSDLSFVSNNCILQTSDLYLSQNHKILGSHIFIVLMEVSRLLCL